MCLCILYIQKTKRKSLQSERKFHPKKKVEINFKKSVTKEYSISDQKKQQKDQIFFVSYDLKYSTNDQK
jgi:hypothetical protein